jgi:hypothetical protein
MRGEPQRTIPFHSNDTYVTYYFLLGHDLEKHYAELKGLFGKSPKIYIHI